MTGNVRKLARLLLLGAPLLLGAQFACVTPNGGGFAVRGGVEDAALTLLEMRPDANWTEAYNRLLEFGPRSIEYVVNRPEMRRRAGPGELRVILHTSLVRMLAGGGDRPELSINCFETSLDVLHFDPRVRGRRLGTVALEAAADPAAWHELYPADFDHELASLVDVEADRRAVLNWWRNHRDAGAGVMNAVRLRPSAERLWPVLSRRYADLWVYEPSSEAVALCASPTPGAALLRIPTRDYNLARAACIWLAGSDAPGVQRELIERVASSSPVMTHNARFALERSADVRIRDVIERYKKPTKPSDSSSNRRSVNAAEARRGGPRQSSSFPVSCEQQGGVAHEMAQVCSGIRDRGRAGDLYGGAFWRR